MKVSIYTLVSSAVIVSAFAQFDQFGGPKNCPAFSCPNKDEVPVSLWPMKLTSSGCSSLSGGNMNMMQFNKPSESEKIIIPCCDLLNACYQICGTSNVFCSKEAEACLDTKCDDLKDNEEMHKSCKSDVSVKKIMLSFGGCTSFDAGQKQNCKCVKKSEFDDKREETVHGFYKKFNPENIDKVEGLVKKASDQKKFAGLLYKLVKKYPRAIKKVKDPQQKIMEEMMRNIPETDSIAQEDVVEESDPDERIEL